MKTIICMVGKTSSGKDTVTRHIMEKFGLGMVCSYTTRPIRESEVEGREHYFVTKEQMKELLKTEHVIAYTKNNDTGIEYFATAESVLSDNIIYIINPEGIAYMKEHLPENFRLLQIYVYLDEKEIERRAMLRGDAIETFTERINSERAEFDAYYNAKEYDYVLDNSKSKEEVFAEVDAIIEKELKLGA